MMIDASVFLTDYHCPFHDPRAHALALLILDDLKPAEIIVGSDGIDCYSISRWDRNPARKDTLQDEIDTWIELVKEIKQTSPDAILTWIKGNHEDRLRRLIWNNVGLFGLRALEWPNLLKFEELGIRAGKNNEVNYGDLAVVKHGSLVRQDSAYTAKGELEKEKHDIVVVSGHTHRAGAHYVTKRSTQVAAFEAGCLCSFEVAAEYTKGVVVPNWQHCVTVIWHGIGYHRVEPIVFEHRSDGKYCAIFQGKEYVA